jgi:hypothetical protein
LKTCFHGSDWSSTINGVFYAVRAEIFYPRHVWKFVENKTRVEEGSNTSTVTLRVIGGDVKGSLKSETVKYGLETKEPRTREGLHWRGPVVYTKDRPVFSSERAPHKNRTVIVKQ